MKHFYKHISLLALCFCAATQGLYSQTPGGVTGANLWLKADAIPGAVDGAAVSSWSNTASGSAVLAPTSSVTSAAPVFKSGYVSPGGNKIGNFNPSVFFGGANSLAFSNMASGTNYSAFSVTETDDITSDGALFGSTNIGGICNTLRLGGNNTTFSLDWGGGIFITTPANTIKPNVTQLVGLVNGGAATSSSLSVDGLVGASANMGYNIPLCFNTILGNAVGASNFFMKGTIQEVILYPNTATLTVTNALKINSYLALKYGITLSQASPTNYLASNGTAMWTASLAATGFTNNIFGIGNDNGSGLSQKVSASVNASNIVTLATTNNFSLSNQDVSRTALSDLTFEMISNNSGAATWTGTGAITNYSVLSRAWQVQETGSVGNVFVQFDVANATFDVPNLIAGTNYYILTDPNGDGNYTDGTATALTNTSGNLWSTSIDFTNGSKFTLATLAVIAPGGVAGSGIWLKADVGVTGTSSVSAWADQSGFARHVTQAAPANQPSLLSSYMNYNPALYFQGAPNGSGSASADYLNAGLQTLGVTNALSVFCVTSLDVSGIHSPAGHYDGWTRWRFLSNGMQSNKGGGGITSPINTPFIMDAINSNTLGSCYANGLSAGSATLTAGNYGSNAFLIGWAEASGRYSLLGKLSEVIVYNTDLSAAQALQMRSYLALKYGITLDKSAGGSAGNYLLSNGSVAWTASITPNYHNKVMGIVRDDASGLIQKQSRTLDDTTRIYINTLATDNASNSGSFSSDLQSVVMGTDGKLLRSAPSTTAELPTGVGITSRIEREWKITNTSFNGTFSLDVKLNTSPITASDLRILIDDDGDFTNATLYSPTISYAGGVVTISGLSTTHIPLNATKYLTIVSLSTSTPLPIGLLAFHATAMDNSWVKLDWKTETELNNHYFTIEKSADGIGWEELARVEGAGTSTTLRTYLAADSSPYEGMSYYRLKQTDFNYKYSYSAIKTVMIDKDGKGVRMYPNPFLNVITIEGPASETNTLKVYTVTGKEVTGLTKLLSADATHVVLDGSKLSSGIYLIKTNTTSHKIYKE